MKTAVLVIDVQHGLCVGEGKAFDCDGLITRINLVTSKAQLAGAPVIFIQHESTAGYLEHGSAYCNLANGLVVSTSDIKVRKTTPDSFLRTDLETLLRNRGVEQLVICDMHSEFCIDTTTRRAMALGFTVTLVEDGHTSAGNAAITAQQVIQHTNATLTNISSFGPRTKTIRSESLVFTP